MRARLSAVLLSAALQATGQEAPAPLRELRLEGATVFTPEQVTRLLRVETGRRLFQPPQRLAGLLAQRYHDDGYLAARVEADWDEEAGRLLLRVDEGRLARVAFPGLGPAAERRARRGAALPAGASVRRAEIEAAQERLEEDSEGALRAGDFEATHEADGVRVDLRPQAPALGFGWAPHGPHTGGYYNRVDGFDLGLSAEVRLHDRRRYEHTRLDVAVARALAAEAWRHAVSLARPVLDRRLELGYEHHDLTDRDDALRLYGLDEAPGTSLLEQAHSDFFRRNGHEAWAFWRAHPRWQLGLSWRADRYSSLPLATDGDPFGEATTRPNPPIDEGAAHALLVTLRAARGGPLFPVVEAERASYRLRSLFGSLHEVPDGLRLEATLERASASALGGDFTFTRLTASLRGRQALGAGLRADSRVLAALGDAGLPSQKRLTLSGQGLLRGYPDGLYRSSDALLLTGELSWAAGPWPRLLAFYDGGQGWELDGAAGTTSGWRQDAGLGLRWPPDAGAFFLRVELARPLGDETEGGWRTLWRLQVPF